jgi:uncharacterized protein YqeY
MSLTEKINNDIKDAMKARDKGRLEALRAIKSALLLEATKGGDSTLSDETGIKLLQKLHKQRLESLEIYTSQGRKDLAEEEQIQADVIAQYLPKQLSAEELEPIVRSIIEQVGAEGMKDMGKVMGKASGQLAGKAPGKLLADTVKRLLAS